MREWFAVRTQPRNEFLARTHFERQGFETYLPVVRGKRSHARRVELVTRPFFPGYLFLHLEEHERNWTTIASTIGAASAVRFGDCYPPVPAALIAMLRNREDASGHIQAASFRKVEFQRGDRVIVMWNHIQDLYGLFEARRGEDRAIILLDLLKRHVTVEVPLDLIRAV